MKRISVVGLKSHTERILNHLRDTGVLHITHVKPPEGPSLEQLADKIFLAQTALLQLGESGGAEEPEDVTAMVEAIVVTAERLEKCEEALLQLQQEERRTAFLGPFDPRDIDALRSRGIAIRLYEIRARQRGAIPPATACAVLDRPSNGTMVIAVISRDGDEVLPFTRIPLPQRSIIQLRDLIRDRRTECEAIRAKLTGYAVFRPSIEKMARELKSQLDVERVRSGMGEDQRIVFTRGYCPIDGIDCLRASARKNGWGLLIEDPVPGEEPPTLVRNPRWVRIIRPVFALLNTIPGYRELDISSWFLLFFSIFFGMIIGDAGYGVLLLTGAAVARWKLDKKTRKWGDLFSLLFVLSGTTILWGAVTGNWFGIQRLTELDPFRRLIIPGLNAYTVQAQRTVMSICFYIAAIHLSLAHLLVMRKDFRITNALANAGWIMMVWVMFFVAQNQVMGAPLPFFFTYLLAGAGLLIAAFTLLDRVPGKGLAEKLIADIVLATINTFADTISYIRLFAVGLATLAVAQSFNEIALQVGFHNPVAGLGSALILVIGHSLNIALAAMAVIVHGVRLNMLEFSGHVGNTWSGYAYAPFSMRDQEER